MAACHIASTANSTETKKRAVYRHTSQRLPIRGVPIGVAGWSVRQYAQLRVAKKLLKRRKERANQGAAGGTAGPGDWNCQNRDTILVLGIFDDLRVFAFWRGQDGNLSSMEGGKCPAGAGVLRENPILPDSFLPPNIQSGPAICFFPSRCQVRPCHPPHRLGEPTCRSASSATSA